MRRMSATVADTVRKTTRANLFRMTKQSLRVKCTARRSGAREKRETRLYERANDAKTIDRRLSKMKRLDLICQMVGLDGHVHVCI